MGLYISIPVYFVLLLGCAYWARKKMEKMEHDKVSDKLQAHYLGGRLFGPVIIAGTLFASLFSGYTVIGIPNEGTSDHISTCVHKYHAHGALLIYILTPHMLLLHETS